MILPLYRSELLKLRHTKIYSVVILAAVLGNLVSIFMLLPTLNMSGQNVAASLQEVFYRQGNLITIIGPFVFALIAGYIFSKEYSERTINQLFTYPVSRTKIFFAKLCVVFFLIIVTVLFSCIAAVIIGAAKASTDTTAVEMILRGITMNLSVCLLSFGTIPLAIAVSMISKSIIPPMVLGTFASLVTLLLEIGHGMKSILFPWTTPYILVREFGSGFSEMGPNPYTGIAFTSLAILFVCTLVFCIAYYSRAEIHSGS